MNLEIVRPAALLLWLLLPLLWWWHRRSIAPLRGKRRLAAFLTRAAIVAIVIFALAEPRWRARTDRQEVFFVVDRSLSLDDAALAAAEAFVAGADLAGAETAWLGFGGRGEVAPSLEALKATDRERINPRETRIDTALSLAAASFRPGRVKTVVLFSDGVATGGEVDPAALKANDIRVQAVPVAPPDRPEVLVREVTAPAVVRVDEPLSVEAVIQSTRAGPAEVDLFRNGVRVATRRMERTVGANHVRFEQRAGRDKLLHYEVGVRAAEDTLSENNQAGTAVISEGASRVLLLTDRPDSARYLEWALRQEGIGLSVRPGEGCPTEMSDLQNFDAVIFDNLAASALSRTQMELFSIYVSDFGGGFLMLGGDQAYGLGGYFRTPIEAILPVSCDFQKEEETPSLALVLVIDRSGSMAGENIELAKAAAKASADLLGPRDYISVIAFDGAPYLIVPLQPAGNSGSVAAGIASITADGGTNLAPAMEEALRQLSGNSAKLKHVILLTDGMSQDGPFYELTTQMARNGITVSSVGMGSGADGNLLSQIAQWGNGRYYEAIDPATVPQIFTKETMTASKSAIQEFPFLAKPIRAVDFLEGIEWSNTPFLLGYVRTKPKPTSETWLLSERGDPLLTTWRFGLGTAAAFTSDARNRWAVEWLRWPGFGKFWGQLLRRISRPASLGFSELAVEERDGAVQVTVDALDPQQGFPAGVEASIRLADPKGGVRALPMEKSVPGRWIARFQTAQPGIYSGQMQLNQPDGPLDSRFFTVTRGFSREFLLEPPDTQFLGALARETGGRLSPDPATLFRDEERTAAREWELWPWLALSALLLFVGDVGLRRWPQT